MLTAVPSPARESIRRRSRVSVFGEKANLGGAGRGVQTNMLWGVTDVGMYLHTCIAIPDILKI